MTFIIDFDSNDWKPALTAALGEFITPSAAEKLRKGSFRYTDDALKAFAAETDIEAVIDATLDWIRRVRVRAFHGTRLTDVEASAIAVDGLKPLDIQARVQWLRSAVPELHDVLTPDFVDQALAVGNMAHRETQVHAAISRKEMFKGYDYLFEGSEFDRRLLEFGDRDDLVPLLTSRGRARLLKIALPGDEALAAMHPFFDLEFTRRNDGYPNLVRQLLEELVWDMHRPFSARHGIDACFFFKTPIPGHYIEGIETFED